MKMTSDEYMKMLLEEKRLELDKNSSLIERFKVFLDAKNVTSEISFCYLRPIGIIAEGSNIVKNICSSIEEDKEGLFSWNELQNFFQKRRFMSGYLANANYMILAHPYFRRNYRKSNNYTPKFIDLFWALKDENIDAYIAIDLNRVRINMDDSYYMEHDTWFGSPFNKNIYHIEDGVSKLRPPLDLDDFMIEFLFNSVYSLDIMWYTTNDDIKVFQAEEFKVDSFTIVVDDIVYHPVRYIHAEFDNRNGYFRHFDGAVELYTDDEYSLRRDKNFNQKTNENEQIKPNSIKLFKLNGEISVEMWIDYISHFFTQNPLVMEYFSGSYPEHVCEALAKIKKI